MTSNRWLLPDGVEEVLPSEARSIEALRRQLLDLYHSRGYELVMPPLVEYTDSLLIGLGHDMDLHSFKVADQLSGKMLAVRPDITPQVARIDSHSLAREGVTRYCYAGSVLHTVPMAGASSRSPLQVGAELYGEPSVEADIEVITLMLDTVRAVFKGNICLDLGHVGIYTALVAASGISDVTEQDVFAALQRKSETDVKNALASENIDPKWQQAFLDLLAINGGVEALDEVEVLFEGLSADIAATITECKAVATAIVDSFEDVDVFIDFTELRGYHYHTGLVFAAFVEGSGKAVANGGRYDDIGKVFGRSRPATGFSSSINLLSQFISSSKEQCVFVYSADKAAAASEIQVLRDQGTAVIEGFTNSGVPEICTHVLQRSGDTWVVETL